MASLEFDSVVLRLREGDDVGVLKKTVKGGTELANGELKLTTAVTIPAGHKIALRAVADGEAVRKYGQIIGFAKGDVVPGEHVHSHNLVMKPYEREHSFCVDYSATEFYPEAERRTRSASLILGATGAVVGFGIGGNMLVLLFLTPPARWRARC